jgi:hypothetical protein
MKMRDDDFGRAALGWAARPDQQRPPAAQPSTAGTPVTGYGSASELYAAMTWRRKADLAALAAPARPERASGRARAEAAPRLGRRLAWSLLLAPAAIAIGAWRRRSR